MFTGIGGCALIGTSMININAGARYRTSTFAAGSTVLLVFVVAYKGINLVPLASLAGVMFMIVIHTFAWRSLAVLARAAAFLSAPLWARLPHTHAAYKCMMTLAGEVRECVFEYVFTADVCGGGGRRSECVVCVSLCVPA